MDAGQVGRRIKFTSYCHTVSVKLANKQTAVHKMYGDWLNGDPQARYHKLYTLNLHTAGRGFVNLQTAGRGFFEIVINLNERQI